MLVTWPHLSLDPPGIEGLDVVLVCWVEKLQQCPVAQQGVRCRVQVTAPLKPLVVAEVHRRGSAEVTREAQRVGQDVSGLTPIAGGAHIRQDSGNLEWDFVHLTQLDD